MEILSASVEQSDSLPPLVSVVVLNHNGLRFLRKCLESIEKQSLRSMEVFMVDNASTDDSVVFVREEFPWVRIVENEENLGYAEANNRAAEICGGKFLFFLNNDTWLEADALQELAKSLTGDQQNAACAPMIVDYETNSRFSLGMGCDVFGYPISTAVSRLFYADGAALFVRREVFMESKGFDSRYFMFYEDVDFSWRIQLYGYGISVAPLAIVHHFSGGTTVGGGAKGKAYVTNVTRRYMGERNNICNLLKNYSLIVLLAIVPVYVVINLAEILIMLVHGGKHVAYSYVEAWIWNIRNIGETLEFRSEVQSRRRIYDIEIMRRMYRGSSKLRVLLEIGVPRFK